MEITLRCVVILIMDIFEKNFHFVALNEVMGCFQSMLWFIVYLHCEAPSNVWTHSGESDNIALYTFEFFRKFCRFWSAGNSLTREEPDQPVAKHAHTVTLPPTRLHTSGGVIQITSCSFPSLPSSLPPSLAKRILLPPVQRRLLPDWRDFGEVFWHFYFAP